MIGEDLNNITKARQRLVDRIALGKTITRGASLVLLLGASQIDNIDHGSKTALLTSHFGDLLEVDGNDSMGARRCFVHLGGADGTVTFTLVNDTLDVRVALHRRLLGSLNVDTGWGGLDREIFHSTLRSRHEQILNLLHVDFDHLDGHLIAYVRVSLSIDALE